MFWKILGIEPTNDIKIIKKAYAALAKKYNPEEYPEEFQRIHSAYKSACAYAKREPVPVSAQMEEIHAPDAVKTAEKDYDFSSAAKESAPTENTDEAAEQAVDYDFSPVKSLSEKSPDQLTRGELIRLVLKRFEELLDDPTMRNSAYVWNNFFNSPPVKLLINDRAFRSSADELIGKRKFNAGAAHTVASAFAGKARIFDDGNIYYVDINGRHDKSYYIKGYISIRKAIAVIIASCLSASIISVIRTKNSSHERYNSQKHINNFIEENREYYSEIYGNINGNSILQSDPDLEKIYEEADGKSFEDTVFDPETLYGLAVGSWTVSSGSLTMFEIREDYTCTLYIEGEEYNGTVRAQAAEKGAQIELNMTADSFTYRLWVKMFESGGLFAIIYDSYGTVLTTQKIISNYET